jgi:hypothetical protein
VTSSISRLPYMSPSRPRNGTATAPTSRVAVSSHSTFVEEVCRSPGRVASTGTSSDWVSDTTRVPRPTISNSSRARAADMRPCGGRAIVSVSSVIGSFWSNRSLVLA